MTLSLRAMRYVQSALRHRSIAAAAEEMHVAPSAIATALNQAEDTLGVSLATRARAKGVFPTSDGKMVLRRIDDMLERYDFFLADVSDLKTKLSGHLSIGYNAPIGPAFLPKVTAHMRQTEADVTLSFVEGTNDDIQRSLLEGQVDAILFVENIPSPQIEATPLVFAPTYCLVPADHALGQLDLVTRAQIVQEPLILLDRPAAREFYLDLLSETGVEPNIVATTNSTEMVRSLVAQSFGVSLLNMKPGGVLPYAGQPIRCLPIEGSQNGVQFSLGVPPGPKRKLLQTFITACQDFFQSAAADELIVPFA